MSSPVVPAAVFRRLLRAKEQIDDDYAATLTVDALSRTAALSRSHFVRQFRVVFGVTPHQYLTQVRLARAKVLLARPGASVTQTCLDIGFQSLGSFSSLFARAVGRSPLSWHREVAPLVQMPQGLARMYVPYCFFRGLAGGSSRASRSNFREATPGGGLLDEGRGAAAPGAAARRPLAGSTNRTRNDATRLVAA